MRTFASRPPVARREPSGWTCTEKMVCRRADGGGLAEEEEEEEVGRGESEWIIQEGFVNLILGLVRGGGGRRRRCIVIASRTGGGPMGEGRRTGARGEIRLWLSFSWLSPTTTTTMNAVYYSSVRVLLYFQ